MEFFGSKIHTLYEPFCGSAAITLAAANENLATHFVLGDSLQPLTEIWRQVIEKPDTLAADYKTCWDGQSTGGDGYYKQIRDRFNLNQDPADLLYLLTRCVKNSPRWNQQGKFNQSHDKRRLGTNPKEMGESILRAHKLLAGRAYVRFSDYYDLIRVAGPEDLVYMDPPYEGTTTRYHQSLDKRRLIVNLRDLNDRGVPWVLSLDGQCGDKVYGTGLPEDVFGEKIAVHGGRSTQATLNGVVASTVESLYLSPGLLSSFNH